ncbi:MAG: hypothetical protein K6F46_11645, partial [Desulfovibrio sp.]|nr:hypothetical protein [Desulfovibrio sp.]
MSQGIDIDACREEYNANMGMGAEAAPQSAPATETSAADVADAESVDFDAVTDIGDIEPIDLTQNGDKTVAPGTTLPTGTVVDVLSTWKNPTQAITDYEIETLPQTLHTLRNSLNVNPFELKDLADRSGLSYSIVDDDSGFARKKIESDRYGELMRGFMDNISQTPATAEFLRQADSLEQLALTSDVALSALEKSLDPEQLGFFESGYIGAARNAWNNGMLSREVGELAVKWMNGTITDEERQHLDVLRQAQTYYQKQRENMGLLERMVRGTVEALGVPLAGGVECAFEFLGRYGKEGLAGGAMVGAGFGATAGGVGALPGAVAGGLTGTYAVAQAGFINDMMRQEGAQTFLSLMDMGVPEDTARVLSLAAGGAKGLLEYVGLREVGKIFPGAEKFLTREAATAAMNVIKKNPSIAAALGDAGIAAVRGLLGETGTEVLQEGVDVVAEEAGRLISGVNKAAPTIGEVASRLAETAIQTIESTALVAGAGGAVRGVRHYAVANQRESLLADLQDAQSRTLDTVADAAQNSPVMKDMAGTGEALMQHLSDEGVTPQTVYLKPEAVQQIFFQEENPELMAAAADMGITPESLQENLTLGTDVAVDFAKATTHILKDPERYAALKPDMRLEPSMLTDAEVEEISAMTQDANARLAYLDNLLAPLTEEVNAAQSRYDQRMEIAKPYVEQMRQAGLTENQANAAGLVLAANAERMAEVFGMTPKDYLRERMAGYYGMTQEEFERLASGGLEGLFEDRETAAILQEMGITKGMSRSRKRRQMQPEFDYVYGHVDADSVRKLYGQERVNELRREFGPKFFAKKGEGVGIDVLAQQFYDDERGMYDMNRTDVDLDDFMERVFMPHDEFESGLIGQMRQQMLYQFIGQEGAARLDAAEEATTRLDNLGVARDMEAAGKDAKTIKLATGWERGADGKWRYEIDDSGVTFHPTGDARFLNDHPEYRRYREFERKALLDTLTDAEQAEMKNLAGTWAGEGRRLSERVRKGNATLENVIDAPELFAAYPKLRTIPVVITKFADDFSDYGGFFRSDINGGRIILNEKYRDDKKKMQSVLLHEIQHAIQREEGFEHGGSPQDFEFVVSEFNDEIKFLRNNLEQLEKWSGIRDFVSESMQAVVDGKKKFADHWRDLDEFKKTNPDYLDNVEDIKRYEKKISDAIDVFKAEHGNAMTADEMYRHLMGEVEARNTSRRMNMTAAERLESLASETEDVAREDQITLRQGL